jgi:hypothetical protein
MPVDPAPRAQVWLPWLAAPFFMLLPIGGCGAAASLRHASEPAAAPVASLAPPPIATVVVAAPANR